MQMTHSLHRAIRLVSLCAAVLLWAQYGLAADLFLDPAPEGTFSLIVIPDTQGYRGAGTKAQPKSTDEVTNVAFDTQTRWIVENLQPQRVVFVSHVGDIVDKNVPEQWAVARRCMDRLHGAVPYGIAPGNHDMAGDGSRRNSARRGSRTSHGTRGRSPVRAIRRSRATTPTVASCSLPAVWTL